MAGQKTNVVILAAGRGTRLGMPFPKPLTPLADGRSIMAQQLENIRTVLGRKARVLTVVGFEFGRIIETFPDVSYVFNQRFAETNTSKSLLQAFRSHAPGGILWMNGDVVFEPEVLRRLQPFIEQDTSVLAVNTATVSAEEVKYKVGVDGYVTELSKEMTDPLGESVGINYVSSADRRVVRRRLREVDDSDYFERGIELAIEQDGLQITPVDISDLFAVEVDFPEDLERVNTRRVRQPRR